jgi:membrane associated rhomboid family serine protease/mRNA-degrading endonuclease YafQ of YafQ-DinJ toxin-antitoxin module
LIIIPTEKKFDWKHTPVVLFSFVILNVLIFFLYQTADQEKIIKSLDQYQQLNTIEAEWPIYEKYIKTKKNREDLNYFKALYLHRDYYNLAFYMLSDDEFNRYLYRHRFELENIKDLDVWQTKRQKIVEQLKTSSSFAYGLIPSQAGFFSFISSQFLHGDVMHLFGNMFFLLICGFAVEAAIGHLRFLFFYLISGVAGGLLYVMFNPSSTQPLVGASGAISGVMAMYLGVFRFKKIEFFYWIFIFVGYFRAPALMLLPFYLGKEFYSMMTDPHSNVAFMAHAGGFIAGIGLMFTAPLVNKNSLNQDYVEAIAEDKEQQKQLNKVYRYIERYQFPSARKALQKLIKAFGIDFDLALLQYHLLKPEQSSSRALKNKDHDAFIKTAKLLLEMKNLELHQLARVELVYVDNPQLAQYFNDHDLQQVAWRLADLPDCKTAEDIFVALQEKQSDQKILLALAIKLAAKFEMQQHKKKQQHYQALAESYV